MYGMAVLGFLYNKYILIVSRGLYWVGYLIETQKYDTKIKGLEKPYFLMPLCRDGGWQ